MNEKIICKIKKTLKLISAFMILFLVTVYVKATSYSVLVTDDFIHGYIARTVNCIKWNLVDGIRYSAHMYMTWQGTYLSMFLQYVLMPINDLDMNNLRVVMTLNTIIFFSSMLLFIWSCIQNIDEEKSLFFWIISAAYIYMLCSYCVYDEVFFWYSGAASYGFTTSLLFIALTFVLTYGKHNKKVYWWLALIIGFLTMGSSLAVAGMGCFICLLFLLYRFLALKKFNLLDMILFGVWVLGALINTLAPGNYIRFDSTTHTSKLEPVLAVVKVIKEYKFRMTWFAINSDWIVVLGIVLLLSFIFSATHKISREYIIVSALSVLLPAVVLFPVALGYADGGIPFRCIFVMDIAIIGVAINWAVIIGNVIRTNIVTDEKLVRFFTCICVLGIVVVANCDNYFAEQNNCFAIAKQVVNGTYKEHFDACKEFYAYLKNQEGTDVILKNTDIPEEIPYIYNLRIDSDMARTDLRVYYKLNSIDVIEE